MTTWFLTALTSISLLLWPISADNYVVNDKEFQHLELERVHSQKEIACLAVNIYHEDRGESSEGQLAVAFVTLNRVASEAYPNTVCGVVYQGKHRPSWKDKD